MEFFEKPSAAQLNAAFPYQRLTITGKSGDALWHQLYRLRLAADDDAKEDNKLVARDLTRARREATALAVVAAYNEDRRRPIPLFSVREDDDSRRCAFIAICDGQSGGWRAEDRSTFEPLADALAEEGGRLVVLSQKHRDVTPDLVLVSPHVDVEKTSDSFAVSSLKASGAIVYCNGRNSFWAAFAENDDDDDTKEAPSAARRPRRRGAAAAPVAPPKPVKSPEEIADLTVFCAGRAREPPGRAGRRRAVVPGALLVLRAEPDGSGGHSYYYHQEGRGAGEHWQDGPPVLWRVLPDERLRQVEPGLLAEGSADGLVRRRRRHGGGGLDSIT